jgi:hypothetical protein
MDVAWILNLDAEEELHRGARYTRTRSMHEQVRLATARLERLVLPSDRIIDEAGSSRSEGTGFFGRAWCPTPGALEILRRAGATLPDVPSFGVLKRVNHRRFSAELGQHFTEAGYVLSEADLDALLADSRHIEWLLKRPFGFAGRGRRRVRSGALSDRDRAWIHASFAAGEGLQAEPWVARAGDFALHAYLFPDGRLELGTPTVQHCDRHGAWEKSEVADAGALRTEEAAALERELIKCAGALRDAGYFGAFGLDAFRYVQANGELCFQPRSEINARYSMGWAIGMCGYRPPAGLP